MCYCLSSKSGSYWKLEKIFAEKLYPSTFWEKQTTSKSAQYCHYIKTGPLIFTVHQWADVYIMGTLAWNGVSETHRNLADPSKSDWGVSLSQWTHNLKGLCIRHSYYIQDTILTCNVHSVYCISTEIPLFHNSLELQNEML